MVNMSIVIQIKAKQPDHAYGRAVCYITLTFCSKHGGGWNKLGWTLFTQESGKAGSSGGTTELPLSLHADVQRRSLLYDWRVDWGDASHGRMHYGRVLDTRGRALRA